MSTNSITCPNDVIVDADPGECGATVYFDDAFSSIPASEDIVMIFNGENTFGTPYIENDMRLDGNDASHIDAPWPIPCDNREGALIHPGTSNTWTYKDGQPFTPLRFYACTTNMKFTTGCGTTFVPPQTGEVEFPDTPEWQNITSMTWEQDGDEFDASIDNFRFKATAVHQEAGLESGCFFPVGTTPVTFVSTDESGNETQCTFNVIVRDVEAPVFEVQDITVTLDDDYTATISVDDVIVASPVDNCGVDEMLLSQSTFSCGDQGNAIIDVTVIDINGNEAIKQVNVNVVGSMPDAPSLESIEDQIVCNEYILPVLLGDNLTGDEAYFTAPDGQGQRFEAGTIIAFDDFVQYPVTLYAYDNDNSGPCFTQKEFQLSIQPVPVIDPIDNVATCDSYTLPIIIGENVSATAAYFTLPDGLGTRYEPGETITNEEFENPSTFYAYDSGTAAGCAAQQAFSVDLDNCGVRVAIDATATSICSNQTEPIILTAVPQGSQSIDDYTYEWRIAGNSQLISSDQTIEIVPEQSTEYEVTIIDSQADSGQDSSTAAVMINVNDAPVAVVPETVFLCQSDQNIARNEMPVQLSAYNSMFQAGSNQLEITYYESIDDAINDENRLESTTTLSGSEITYYTRVTDITTQCFDTSFITFVVEQMPQIQLPQEFMICNTADDQNGADPVQIAIDLPVNDYDFVWTRQYDGVNEVLDHSENILSTSELGNYTVEVTSYLTGCTQEVQTMVMERERPIDLKIESDFITDIESHEITVILETRQDHTSQYQVSLLDGVWYDMEQRGDFYEYTFTRVETDEGLQEVSVRDLQGCYFEKQEVITIGIPQYFTPNGDGYNDTWNIRGGKNLDPSSQLLLYDRYGKLLVELEIDGNGWDGTLNGQPLPSTDYWFTLTAGDGNMTRGHFALKR